MTTIVYTDGACLGNPGPGGWAWAVPNGPFASGAEAQSTNQRMEIRAVLEALTALDGRVHVMSDSTYVVNCFRDRWFEGWLARGWKTTARKDVANRDLWEPLIDLYLQRRGEVTFEWVKGHGSDPVNDLVDRLAVEAAQTQQGRTGTGTPADVGPPDDPAGSRRDARLPAGRLVLVTGHRPPELGGYGPNPVAANVEDRLTEILTAKRELHPDVHVVTGLQLGAEQIAAAAAVRAGVPFVVVLPYPDPDSKWPDGSKRIFRELAGQGVRTIRLQEKPPTSKQLAGRALARRDAWVAAQCDEAIVVWNGKDPMLAMYVRGLEDKLGDDVWIVDPGMP